MTKLVVLHGLGQTASDWQAFKAQIEGEVLVIELFSEVTPQTHLTLATLVSKVEMTLKDLKEPFYLCGLSLGGLLALIYASARPSPFLKGLIVVGAIYKSLPRSLNLLQTGLFYILPAKKLAPLGLSRQQLLSLMKSIQVDLSEDLQMLPFRCLILCGEKDRVNRQASQEIHAYLPQSDFHLVVGAGHEINKDQPQEFADLVRNFMGKEDTIL